MSTIVSTPARKTKGTAVKAKGTAKKQETWKIQIF